MTAEDLDKFICDKMYEDYTPEYENWILTFRKTIGCVATDWALSTYQDLTLSEPDDFQFGVSHFIDDDLIDEFVSDLE